MIGACSWLVLPLQLTSRWSCWDWDWTFHFQLCSAPWGAAHSNNFGVWIKFFNILVFEVSLVYNILPIITNGTMHENNSGIKCNQVKEKCPFRISLKFLCTKKSYCPKTYALIWYSFVVVLITQSLHTLHLHKQLRHILNQPSSAVCKLNLNRCTASGNKCIACCNFCLSQA